MLLKRTLIRSAVFTAAITAGVGAATAAPPDPGNRKHVPLTLSGCVIAGEAKDSFLLTNVTIDSTTATPPGAFYRFNSTDGLKDHVGHRVEVKGKADLDDVDKGKVRVKVDDGKATTEVRSEGRSVKVDRDVWFGSTGSMKLSADVPTYKFEVENVTRLQGNCSSSGAAR